VADVVKPSRWKPKEMETWSTEEARRSLSVAGESTYGPVWLVALATSMRKGELLGLRWCDVDFERDMVSVRQTVGKLRGKIEIKPPKSPKSRREINVTQDVLDAVRTHTLRQRERRLELGSLWTDHDLVFPNAISGPIHADNIDRDYDRLVKKSGVKWIRTHDCRHSFATLDGRLGVPIKVISESLGHADVATTLRIYTHVIPAQRVELAEKVGAALFGSAAEVP
jgi:integrase